MLDALLRSPVSQGGAAGRVSFPACHCRDAHLFALVVWRIGRAHALFANSVEAQGQITCHWIVRDRGRGASPKGID
jgi:hypothetical protein